MNEEKIVEMIKATNEVIEDMKTLDSFYNKGYLNLEEYYKVKNNMIQCMLDIKNYYDSKS